MPTARMSTVATTLLFVSMLVVGCQEEREAVPADSLYLPTVKNGESFDLTDYEQKTGLQSAEYRIVRVNIPPDSIHRSNQKIDNRGLYIVLKEDGNTIGKSSTKVNGWEAEFPRGRWNTWQLHSEPAYTIELWYGRWRRDILVLTIAGLSMEDFQEPIREKLGPYDPPDRAVIFDFEKVQ